jgi:hypothetical protein
MGAPDESPPGTVVFELGPLAAGAGPFLCDQLTALLLDRPEADTVICDVAALERPTPQDLDHLGRLRVAAARLDRRVRLRGVGVRLGLVLTLTGLGDVFGLGNEGIEPPATVPSALDDPRRARDPVHGRRPAELDAVPGAQPHGQLEQREQPLDVQVVADPADPAV